MTYDLALYLGIIISSFYLLLKSADYLVASASRLGEKAGISKFVIGLTLVAVGTSLPELFTSIFGIIDSNSNSASFVFGTILGSNIANILLVFSILLLFSKSFKIQIKAFDIAFLSLTTFSLYFLIKSGSLNIYYSIIYLISFIFYLYFCVKLNSKKEFEDSIDEIEKETNLSKKSNFILFSIFIISLFGLNLAAKGVVYGITEFGKLAQIPITFLTFTTVAFATSLPEMFVSYSSAKKREFDLAIGNIIGSNISNILLILGISGLIKNVKFNPNLFITNLYFLFFVTILFIFILLFKSISTKKAKFLATLLFLIYISYIILIF